MIGTYASAILITGAAVLIGRGICVLSGNDGSTWLSPAVGFAALMFLCDSAIALPGRAWTAVAAVVVACAASVWLPRRRHAAWPSAVDGVGAAVLILAFVSIPFLANDRVGVLGISVLNDSQYHLILAEGLRHPAIQTVGYGAGYPLGPHAVAATFAQALGTDVGSTFTGVLMATPVLTGLTSLALLGDISRPRRLLVAVLAAVPYLAAAWYVQSAFKEPILALLMVGLVVALWTGRRARFARPAAVVIPIAVLIVGVLYDYSYPGLLWPAAIIGCWLALELVLGGAWRRPRFIAGRIRTATRAFALGVLVLVVLVVPEIGNIHTFWVANGGTAAGTVGGITLTGPSALGNLAAPLRSLEGLNIWLNGNSLFPPADQLQGGLLAGLALIVLLFAVAAALERGELVWPAAVLALVLAYAYTKHTQSPHVAAKGLMIPGPLLALGSGAELMRWLQRAPWRSYTTVAVAGVAIVFFVFAFDSSYLVLRDAAVGPSDHVNELRSLRPLLHGRPTVTLLDDDYVQWELLGVPLSSPIRTSVIPAFETTAKPWTQGELLDFDSLDASTLDRFEYVITTRGSAQSVPPPNFHLIGTSRSYEVWRRIGPTPPHLILNENGTFGAILDCRTPDGRRISRLKGYAIVRPQPLYFNLGPLIPGASEHVTLGLPAGAWDVSLPFVSGQAITVRGGGLNAWLPPNLDRPGNVWPVGSVRSTGSPVTLTIKVSDPGLIQSSFQLFIPEQMVVMREAPPQRVPLRAACGRYVDWYVPG